MKLPEDGKILGVNKLGHTLDYDSSYCSIVRGHHVCDGTVATVRKGAATCAGKLWEADRAASWSLPEECKEAVKLVAPTEQDWLIKGEARMLFSPQADMMSVKADNGSFVEIGMIPVGLSKWPANRTLSTSTLILSAVGSREVIEKIVLDQDEALQLADDVMEIASSVSFLGRVNDTAWKGEIEKLIRAEGRVGTDIVAANRQLEHIEAMDIASNFSINHFTLNKIDGVDGAISWLAVCVVLLLVVVPVLICCGSCACCRSCGVGLVKGLWYTVKCVFCGSMELTKYLRRTEQKDGDGEKRRDTGTAGNEGNEMLERMSGQVSSTVELPHWKCNIFGLSYNTELGIADSVSG
jgi:hypothetical protein